MTIVNPPAYISNGQYDARIDRLAITSNWGYPGIISGLTVSQATTPDMKVVVSSGRAAVPNSFSAFDGYYIVSNDGSIDVTVPAADSTYSRIDVVVARVFDSSMSGSYDSSTIELVQGTPAVAPVVPTLPSNAVELARITVPAAATSIVSGNINQAFAPLARIRQNDLPFSGGIHPATTTTTRGQFVDRAVAQGVSPSTATPMFFFRANAGTGKQLEYTVNGTDFFTVQAVSSLPAPRVVAGPATNNIVNTTDYVALPADVNTTVTLDNDCWVQFAFGCSLVRGGASEFRMGVKTTGATITDPGDAAGPGSILWVGTTMPTGRMPVSGGYVQKLNAGTNNLRLAAYTPTAASTTTAAYAYLSVTPLYWA